jgi:hypothetical protein
MKNLSEFGFRADMPLVAVRNFLGSGLVAERHDDEAL